MEALSIRDTPAARAWASAASAKAEVVSSSNHEGRLGRREVGLQPANLSHRIRVPAPGLERLADKVPNLSTLTPVGLGERGRSRRHRRHGGGGFYNCSTRGDEVPRTRGDSSAQKQSQTSPITGKSTATG
jgi:hypothetical protein